MELTLKQEQGLRTAVERYLNHEPYTCIAGFAGSGKTTLVKFILEALEVDPDDVANVSFTGKAAEVLAKKGNKNAMTAHKLLYNAVRLSDGNFMFIPKDRGELGYRVIVVDEVSMLPKTLWDLLLSHGIYVIACGDPGQLPPVAKGGADPNNHVLDNPHVFLDEIMRQAKDSEIIRLSMDIREGRPLSYFKGTEVMIVNQANIDMYSWADQILVAKNNTRRDINNLIRSSQGRGMEPESGDKVISLTNHWEVSDITNHGAALVNGTIGYLTDPVVRSDIYYPIHYGGFPQEPVPVLFTGIQTDYGDVFGGLKIDYTAMTSMDGHKFLTPKEETMIFKNLRCKQQGLKAPFEFNYGYAITCHKAQGSQWDKILVVEEDFPWDREEHKRWLYTAVTRAVSRCVLVR